MSFILSSQLACQPDVARIGQDSLRPLELGVELRC